jgi:two-component system KDP operon response regulator KdpE
MTAPNPEILVIDDELQIRKLLQITLQSHNFSVILTNTSAEGLAAAANKNPDLILLDLGLPDENGHETLRKLREWSKVPLIILTVQSREEDIIRALDNGANDYLVTNRTVKVNDEPVQLTQTQYALMVLFVKNEGKVLTHQYILRQIWGEEFINQLQYLRVFVAQLRKRLEQNKSGVVYISTVSGVGYRFVCKPLEE